MLTQLVSCPGKCSISEPKVNKEWKIKGTKQKKRLAVHSHLSFIFSIFFNQEKGQRKQIENRTRGSGLVHRGKVFVFFLNTNSQTSYFTGLDWSKTGCSKSAGGV